MTGLRASHMAGDPFKRQLCNRLSRIDEDEADMRDSRIIPR